MKNKIPRNWYVSLLLVVFTISLFTFVVSCGGSDGNSNGAGPTSSGSLPTGGGATYYVAPNGDDNNPGTKAQPWQTIGKAAATLVSGDTVYIRAGTYQERVVPQNSGSDYIMYAAYPGERVTIDGSGVSMPSGDAGLFEVSGLSNIRISGLRIINVGPDDNHAGILVGDSSHIIIDNNYTYNTTSSGIGVWSSSDVTIDGNEVELACNNGEQESITVAGTNTFEIRNNHVHHSGPGTNGGEGIDAKDGSSNGRIYNNHVHHLNNRVGIYVEAWDKHTYNIEVYRNIVYNIINNDGFAIGSEEGGLLENIRIYNNIAYNNELSGIAVSAAGDAATHPIRNARIINNTFYNNGGSIWGGGISIENPDVSDLIIRNNICSQNRWFQIQVEVPVQITIDHNLINGTRGDDENDGSDVVEDDPMFSNPSGGDFHLQSGSPAIDTGSSADAPFDDYDGMARPQGGGYDIGAFER